VLLSNPGGLRDPGDFSPLLGPDFHRTRIDRFMIVSRFPILRAGIAPLDLPDPNCDAHPRDQVEKSPESLFPFLSRQYMEIRDPGSAAFVVLDTTARLGRPLTVWMLDLPSNPRFFRLQMAQLTRQRISAAGERDPSLAFPDPDIIAGDLNIPARSASLGVLAPGMRESASMAGAGYIATWPRRHPVYQLDHVLLSGWLRATAFRVIDAGLAEHRMEWVEVTGK
jgi:hypothetical protein